MKNQRLYVLSYQPGPAWKKGVEVWNQDLKGHAEYISSLNEKGLLKFGGPFTDSSGGMAILCASSVEEASAVLARDPSITAGVFIGQAREWLIVFQETK